MGHSCRGPLGFTGGPLFRACDPRHHRDVWVHGAGPSPLGSFLEACFFLPKMASSSMQILLNIDNRGLRYPTPPGCGIGSLGLVLICLLQGTPCYLSP